VSRAWLLAGAAAVYLVAAWSAAPGFYDGFAPPQPYNFVCPPPIAGANLPPASGHLVIKVIGGVSDANSAFTDDGQVVIGFLPGAFDVTGKTQVTVDIKPVSPCPKPSGLKFVTNTYQITADAPLASQSDKSKWPTLVMRYSNLEQDPSYVYRAQSLDGPWTNIGALQQAQVYTIDARTDQLGYFAAGFPSGAISGGGGGVGGGSSQILPVTIAVLIVLVLVGGVPLSIIRRRQARGEIPAEDDEDE
jgi:hypothetical protein